MPLADIPVALLTVTENVGHYEAFEQSDQYIVWAEDTQADSIWADDEMQEQAIQGTIVISLRQKMIPKCKKSKTR